MKIEMYNDRNVQCKQMSQTAITVTMIAFYVG